MGTIIIIIILVVVVVFLAVLIFKTVLSPKKIEAVPRLIKQGKTQNAIKIAKLVLKDIMIQTKIAILVMKIIFFFWLYQSFFLSF